MNAKTETTDLESGRKASTQHVMSSNMATSRKEDRRKSRLALIDQFSLRRESTHELLRTLLHERALCFATTTELLSEMHRDSDAPRGVIISLGGQSVAQPRFLDELRQLLSMLDATPVVILSDREGVEEVIAAFRAGVRGYVPTSMEPPVVIQAIRMVLSGGAFFPAAALAKMRVAKHPCRQSTRSGVDIATIYERDRRKNLARCGKEAVRIRGKWQSRQLSVLALIVEGKANKEIARALAVDESTVKSRVRQIMRKLGVTNRTQIALCARKLELPEAARTASLGKGENDGE